MKPAKSKTKELNVLLSCNDFISKYIPALLSSISINHKDYHVNVYLMHCANNPIAADTLSVIYKFSKEIGIHFTDIAVLDKDFAFFYDLGNAQISKRWPVEAFLYFLCHNYLPKKIDRVLYFDIDVIINDDLYDFYISDFNDKYLTVIPFNKSTTNSISREDYDLSRAKNGSYFNSGVMVINVEKFRTEKIDIDFYKKHVEEAEGLYKNSFLADQGILNYIFCHECNYIYDPNLNLRVFSIVRDWVDYRFINQIDTSKVRVAHYNLPDYKGWNCYFDNIPLNSYVSNNFFYTKKAKDFFDLYWEYASTAPFYEENKLKAIVKTRALSPKRIDDTYTQIDFVDITDRCVSIEGYMIGAVDVSEIFFVVNGEIIWANIISCHNASFVQENSLPQAFVFKGEIPITEDKTQIKICSRNKNGEVIGSKNLKFGKFAAIGNKFRKCYFLRNGLKLTANSSELRVEKCGRLGHIKSELRFMRQLWKAKDWGAKRAVFARLLNYVTKPFIRKQKWLISDRINIAGDNGEAFFRYLMKNGDKNKKYYFAIHKDSPDRERIKKIGKVIGIAKWRYKFYVLQGATIVSSHADHITPFLFGGTNRFYSDMLQDSKFVFLQHGIIKDNVSNWLNKYVMNFHMFVTSTHQEYESILKDTFYDESQVKMTGLPRHDLLQNTPNKTITIMPTWRKYIMNNADPRTGKRAPRAGFLETEYYVFYNSLLNHPQLLAKAKALGYTLCFKLHPAMQETMDLFDKSECVVFLDSSKLYSEIFSDSSLIVTDYSSVAFDFAYLRKPLIYCHFDYDEFIQGEHVYTKGYFEYERDGFGEVETTLEGTVSRLIEYMDNGCQLKETYLKRIESTFPFNDKNNCQRVYDELKSL